MQVRVRDRTPPPQLAEHWPQPPQAAQPPSTLRKAVSVQSSEPLRQNLSSALGPETPSRAGSCVRTEHANLNRFSHTPFDAAAASGPVAFAWSQSVHSDHRRTSERTLTISVFTFPCWIVMWRTFARLRVALLVLDMAAGALAAIVGGARAVAGAATLGEAAAALATAGVPGGPAAPAAVDGRGRGEGAVLEPLAVVLLPLRPQA